MRKGLALRFTAALLLGLAAGGCGEGPTAPAPSTAEATPVASAPAVCTACRFEDVTEARGVRFVHHQSHGGRVLYLPETLSPGIAALDYDGDGELDLFFVQGAGDGGGVPPPCQLYRRAADGLAFQEVAGAARAEAPGYGQSVLSVDYDNDGYADILITYYREPTRLLHNNGDGTFTEVALPTAAADRSGWQSFAAAFDYDRDGLLDVYVGRYLDFGPQHFVESPKMIFHETGSFPETLLPGPYAAQSKTLLHNEGARMVDVTAAAGVADPQGKGLSAIGADLDDDGWPDLFVANDVSPCALLRNQHDGTFKDVARNAWVGEVRGSMGLALGYRRQSLTPYVVVSHWTGDVPAVYERASRAGQAMRFSDVVEAAGLSRCSRSLVGWAVSLLDAESQGTEGLLIVNGHTNNPPGEVGHLAAQETLLFRGKEQRFEPMLAGGPTDPLGKARVGRAAAVEDYDQRGLRDAVVTVNNGAAEMWRNRATGGAWVGALLTGSGSNRDGVNARVELLDASGAPERAVQVLAGDSYFTSGSRRVLFGLGAPRETSLRVRWLSGRTEQFTALASGHYHRLVEGQGKPPGAAR